MAFAASDGHAALRGVWDALSPEWAYYYALQRDGTQPPKGTTLSAMLETLRCDGQPREADWPYIAKDLATLPSWAPPASPSALFHRDSESCSATLASICTKLDDGRPVLVVMTVSPAFDHGWDTDFVIDADEPDVPKRRHAIVAVGHGARGKDKLLLIRNSWGEDWADGGYAWISERYITPRLAQAALLTEEP